MEANDDISEAPATLNADGITNHCYPWASQLKNDVQDLLQQPGADNLREEWNGRSFISLFQYEYLREDFLRLDVSYLRAEFQTSQWAPPQDLCASLAGIDELPQQVDKTSALTDLCDERYQCTIVDESGNSCGAFFQSRRGLFAHFTNKYGHGQRHLLWFVTINNQCLVFDTTFQDRGQPRMHLIGSFYCGTCIASHTAFPYCVQWPNTLALCDWEEQGSPYQSEIALRCHM